MCVRVCVCMRARARACVCVAGVAIACIVVLPPAMCILAGRVHWMSMYIIQFLVKCCKGNNRGRDLQ